MQIIYFKASLVGLALSIFLYLWKASASRWDKWFPVAKWVVQGVVYAGLIGSLYFLAFLWMHSQEPLDPMFFGGLITAGLIAGLAAIWKMPEWLNKGETVERGSQIVGKKAVIAKIKAEKKDLGDRIVWDGVKIPFDVEPYHFMVTGSTGSGKSVAIRQLLNVIRKRGDTAVIVDSGGEFMASYAQKDDFMINPFDARCAPLNLMLELEGSWDADSLSRSLIPDGTGESKEWNGYAQTLVSSCMQVLCDKGIKDFKDLMWMVQIATIDELKPLLAGTAAASQLESDKTFGSIRTIASNYMKSYSFLKDSGGGGFSVSKFIKSEKPNFLFLTYRDDQLDSLKDMISCMLDITARTVLSMPPSSTRRVWLIVDEFASIGKVQSIEAFATKARKCGGCLLLGFQSVSQLKDKYGEHQAQSILSCLSSSLILRCADYDTAEAMSQMLGEQDVISKTMSTGEGSRNWSEQKSSKRVAMAPELQQLKNCEGYLKLSGDYPICKILVPFPERTPPVTSQFKARDFTKNPMVKPIGSLAKKNVEDLELGADTRKDRQVEIDQSNIKADAIKLSEARYASEATRSVEGSAGQGGKKNDAESKWIDERDLAMARDRRATQEADAAMSKTQADVDWEQKRAAWKTMSASEMSAKIKADVNSFIQQ